MFLYPNGLVTLGLADVVRRVRGGPQSALPPGVLAVTDGWGGGGGLGRNGSAPWQGSPYLAGPGSLPIRFPGPLVPAGKLVPKLE